MAELVDATDSKSVVRKDVQVRFLFWAQNQKTFSLEEVFCYLYFYLVRSLSFILMNGRYSLRRIHHLQG